MTQSPTGGPAQTTYQVASRAGVVGHDAQRVVIVTDGRAAEGGPQQAVYFVSDAEIAAGDFIVTGNKPLPIVQVGAAGVEYPPIAVYDVTGKPDDVQPPQNPVAPPAPQFSAAEIGTIDAMTLVVTFDQDIVAAENDYASGVTVKVNGVTTGLVAGFRQANHAIVNYVVPVLWHGSADVVTWEYSGATGIIVSESDATPLGDVTAQSVTNNCEYAALLDLQADTLVLNDGDPVSTWPDASGNGRDFTQTGTARPTKQTNIQYASPGHSVVVFDGVNDNLVGSNFADNLDSFTIFCIGSDLSNSEAPTLAKIAGGQSQAHTGWEFTGFMGVIKLRDPINTTIKGNDDVFNQYPSLITCEVVSKTEAHLYIQGTNINETGTNTGSLSNYSNSDVVRIATYTDLSVFDYALIHCILMVSPAANATNRAALEVRLAARYGVTL